MKLKLKQPTKYVHGSLQIQDQAASEDSKQQQSQEQQASDNQHQKEEQQKKYKQKKIIKKKHEPSAIRLNKINQTFQNIYHNSNKLFEVLNLDFDALSKLLQVKIKHKCSCNKNVKYYCLKCMQKVCQQPFPYIQLPFQISIIHHQSQKLNKSSALPLKFLTNQVKFHYFSSLHQEKNNKLWQELPKPGKNTYILFPHKQSKLIQQIYGSKQQRQLNELKSETKSKQNNEIKHLVILDCTWFQTDQILEILMSKGYCQYIRIEGYKSIYWRYNHHNDVALCSAQAIAFFMREYQKKHLNSQKLPNEDIEKNQPTLIQKQRMQQKYVKKYDNLLFLYCLNLKMILKQEEIRMHVQPISLAHKNKDKSQ